MQEVRRMAAGDPGMITDAGLGIVAAGLIAVAVCAPPGLVGTTPIVGPSWLLALLPVLMGAPLVLRRRAPLLMWPPAWSSPSRSWSRSASTAGWGWPSHRVTARLRT
jgi:hypothetical protein